jgi:hypothetical protein
MQQAMSAIHTVERSSKIIFWAMVATIVLFVGMYIYFVNKTVLNVVARQNVEAQTSNLNTELGNLESQYIASKNGVTMALAQQMGFQEVANQEIFITRQADGVDVALR